MLRAQEKLIQVGDDFNFTDLLEVSDFGKLVCFGFNLVILTFYL